MQFSLSKEAIASWSYQMGKEMFDNLFIEKGFAYRIGVFDKVIGYD